jgi:trimeric autotransporter adhesin
MDCRRIELVLFGAVSLCLLILAGCGGGSSGASPAAIESVQVTPTAPSVARGTSVALKATALCADRTSRDVTAVAEWRSSDPSIVLVDPATGVATGLREGTVAVTAVVAARTGTQTLTVTSARLVSIEVSPGGSAAVGMKVRYSATGRFSDDSTQDLTRQVAWASSDPETAVVGDDGGVTFLRRGSVRISASFAALSDAVSGSADVEVTDARVEKIQVLPVNAKIAVGTRLQFTAVALLTDGTNRIVTTVVTWVSSDDGIAEAGNAPDTKGMLIAKSAGTVTVKAVYRLPDSDETVVGETEAEVTAPDLVKLQVRRSMYRIRKDTTTRYTAYAVYSDGTSQDVTSLATWYSSSESVAEISNAPGSKGVAKGLEAGDTEIRAVFDGMEGKTGLTVVSASIVLIEVDVVAPSRFPFVPLPRVLVEGGFEQLQAVAVYEDGTVQDVSDSVTWKSDDGDVAKVSNAPGGKGQIFTLSPGTVTITAVLKGEEGSLTLPVKAASAIASLHVTPVNARIAKDTGQWCIATAVFDDDSVADITSSVTWRSSDDGVVAVSNAPATKGFALGTGTGSATVTAFFAGTEGETSLIVSDATLVRIEVSPQKSLMVPLARRQFTATGLFSDGTTQVLTTQSTWDSSDEEKFQIANSPGRQGYGTAVSPGTVEVRAFCLGVEGGTEVTVSGEDLVAVRVFSARFARGTRVQLSATGFFSDGSSTDITGSSAWFSSDRSKAFVSNSRATGMTFGLSAGDVTVVAKFFSISGSASVVVTDAVPVELQVFPFTASMLREERRQFTAVALFSDDSTQDVTDISTWKSSDDSVAEVSNAIGSRGLATAKKTGNVSVRAIFKGIPGSS